MKMVQVNAQGVFAQIDEIKMIATPYDDIEKKWHMKTLKTQVVKMVIFS